MTKSSPSTSKKITILTQADAEVGLGHLQRCLHLADSLSKAFRVSFVLAGEQKSLSLIHEAGFPGKPCTIKQVCTADKAPDILLIDTPQRESKFYKTLREKLPDTWIIALDFHRLRCRHIDMAINLHPPLKTAKAAPDYIRHAGYPFAILRDTFNQCRASYRLRKRCRNILICYGGSDDKHLTVRTLKTIFKHDDRTSYDFHVIIGPYNQDAHKIQSLCKGKSHVSCHEGVSDLGPHMLQADLLFCSGGSTLLEANFLGLPSLVTPASALEKQLAEYAIQQGGSKLYPQRGTQAKSEAWHAALQYPWRQQAYHNARKTFDGKGAMRVLTLILQEYQQFQLRSGHAW